MADALGRGQHLGAGEFAAIDFETATGSRASACAVAVARVRNGRVTETDRWLIQPPGNEYDGFNISIHGIRPEQTADSPDMAEAWPEILHSIDGAPVVAHYAAFDMSVLRSSLAAHGATWPELSYYCTCTLARCAWPGKFSYRLIDLADECGIDFEHHDPGSDAGAAAQLAIACCGLESTQRLEEASAAIGVRPGRLNHDGWSPSGRLPQRLADLRPTVERTPEHGAFVHKAVVFTGTLTCGLTRKQAAQLVVDAGGQATGGVSKRIDYLVLGMQDAGRLKDGVHSAKMLRAMELQRAGAPIELLSEDEFLRMLPG
jgi:DNA polymerase-3 subunit epsilon